MTKIKLGIGIWKMLRVTVDNNMFYIYDISKQWDLNDFLPSWLRHFFDLVIPNHFDQGSKIMTPEK